VMQVRVWLSTWHWTLPGLCNCFSYPVACLGCLGRTGPRFWRCDPSRLFRHEFWPWRRLKGFCFSPRLWLVESLPGHALHSVRPILWRA